VLAFHRYTYGGPRDSVIVIANLGIRSYPNYVVGVPRAGLWRVRLNSDWAGYDPAFGNHHSVDSVARTDWKDGMPHTIDIGIGPYSALILSQDN
jgi:1,4-alpha-glucan branching enzyme